MGFWASVWALISGSARHGGTNSTRELGTASACAHPAEASDADSGQNNAQKKSAESRCGSVASVAGEEILDLSKPMTAPEVPLREELPSCVNSELVSVLQQGCWSILLVPEEEFTRWFAIFADSLRELGRTPIAEHDEYLKRLHLCASGAITLEDGRRFRVEDFRSFNEFGDRYTLQFFEEGIFSCDESIERRRANIRLVNRLKPADAVTAKNEDSLATVVSKAHLTEAYLDHLVKDGLLGEERRAQVSDADAEFLPLIRGLNIPRKMAAIALAECLGVEYLEVGSEYFDKAVTHLFSAEWKYERQVFPFIIEKNRLRMAMADPTDINTIKTVEQVAKVPVKVYCSAARDIDNMIKKAHKDD